MKRATSRRERQTTFGEAALASISLDRADREPLHRQLAAELKRLILAQTIAPGARLPSSRIYAEELGVSRATVVAAIDELVAEGYAEGRHGSGVFVAPDLPDHVLRAAQQLAPVRETALPRPDDVRPFQPAAPELALFPHEIWAKLMLKTWRNPIRELLASPDPLGWAPLRLAIADHLRAFRGMRCAPEQVVITSGAGEALELLGQSILARGDKIIIEEPGYVLIRRTFTELGFRTAPIPVDADGLDIARGPKDARAAVVTPARHYPLGMTMPLSRRLALLDWARQHKTWIIEDDYDSEYRYHGKPLPALMGVDDSGVVISLGSFSKTMLPGLRIGYLVVPPTLINDMSAVMRERGARVSLFLQPVLADFMRLGHYAIHIRRMRRLYTKRQTALREAVQRYAQGVLATTPEPAGMHLICTLENGMDDREASRRAAAVGLLAPALSDYFAGKPFRHGLVLGYAGFDEAVIDASIRKLADALR
ncbi:PLP-dependent aminotransferase family protein [Nordella sp. HKS 07]|uniref:MocR-like pyridoxine biosynthesis transcription factor PdxR n=1 Tax=Nordella sp. HKS 07 TaxID=2712222 RepID=UPI0013E1163F|nr:PLP-dependent aminotransferase family protein [Nordella sp. HKS 07]QIG50044.1 PLP-dependent aminotransferase family protein [Nordella sp. HKS 07]